MMSSYQPGLRISEYLLEERIGVGSFGEVWKARHHVWESEHVAIKLPTEPEYVRYLQREGIVVHGLRHPNVVRVLGLDPYAENPYLVMELVRGPALRQVLDENKKGLAVVHATKLLAGVLHGVSAAHAAGVLHRDLKPGNVLLDLNGRGISELEIADVKVGDFGLGLKSVDSLRSVVQSASIDRENKLVGTLAYMAPELRDGHGKADARSDLYSIGVMLFEMLTGERPAGAELPSSLRSETPRWLDEIFQRLYARYDRRFESAEAVLSELQSGMRTSPPPVPRSPVPAPVGDRVDLYLRAAGGDIPKIIDLLREAQPWLSVADATKLANRPNSLALTNCDARVAERWRRILEDHGAKVTLVRAGEPRPAESNSRCQSCGSSYESDDQFCTTCGKQLVQQIRRCRCGAYPGPRDQFCILCGESLTSAVGA